MKTILYEEHSKLGATFTEFAGVDMPLKYGSEIKEHLWVRDSCGVFDVSHMGQLIFKGKDIEKLFSYITPTNFVGLIDKRAKYTVLLNEEGGIVDDLIISKVTDNLYFVVINAARKKEDIDCITKYISKKKYDVTYKELTQRGLIAVQGKKSKDVLSDILNIDLFNIERMSISCLNAEGEDLNYSFISRTGYTGEDGFEISFPKNKAQELWRNLVSSEYVKPIGLVARDTLRLEAGYPLYGNDLTVKISPIEASLGWVVSKEHKGYLGESRIVSDKLNRDQLKVRKGLKLLEQGGIIRAGMEMFVGDSIVGSVTSGGYSPVLDCFIAQVSVDHKFSKLGQVVVVKSRNRYLEAVITKMPFVEL